MKISDDKAKIIQYHIAISVIYVMLDNSQQRIKKFRRIKTSIFHSHEIQLERLYILGHIGVTISIIK